MHKKVKHDNIRKIIMQVRMLRSSIGFTFVLIWQLASISHTHEGIKVLRQQLKEYKRELRVKIKILKDEWMNR